MTDPTTPADTLREQLEDAVHRATGSAGYASPENTSAAVDAVLSVVESHVKSRLDAAATCFVEGHRMEIDCLTRERDEARTVVLPDDWRERIGVAFDSAWHYRSARALVEELVESWPATPTSKEIHDA